MFSTRIEPSPVRALIRLLRGTATSRRAVGEMWTPTVMPRSRPRRPLDAERHAVAVLLGLDGHLDRAAPVPCRASRSPPRLRSDPTSGFRSTPSKVSSVRSGWPVTAKVRFSLTVRPSVLRFTSQPASARPRAARAAHGRAVEGGWTWRSPGLSRRSGRSQCSVTRTAADPRLDDLEPAAQHRRDPRAGQFRAGPGRPSPSWAAGVVAQRRAAWCSGKPAGCDQRAECAGPS